ncbi:sca1 complex scaffold protein scaa [Anaeramoeba ignava]|uniref:Sca1 complex scaffold protein scaa n=1 Tax=Anaeramoeba ignava TaxID=1746090 RepID=A0A9Q0L995_ANAIG|nr:sca1 complex scaffold protein scaa [Anaeramoeba ignava]
MSDLDDLINEEINSNIRKFKTIENDYKENQENKENEENKENKENPIKLIPFFVGFNKKYYDIFFNEQNQDLNNSNSNSNSNESENDYQQNLKKYSPKKLNELPEFPQIDKFKTFVEFEQAVLEWKTLSKKYIGFDEITAKSSEIESDRKISFDHRKSSDSSFKYTDKIMNVLDNPEKNSEMINLSSDQEFSEPLPQFLTKKTSILDENDIWKHQLFIPPPEEEFYSSYEEFENAYLNWANLMNNELKIIPPHPKQISELYGIKIQEKKKKQKKEQTENEKSSDPQKEEKKLLENLDNQVSKHWIWIKNFEKYILEFSYITEMNSLKNIQLFYREEIITNENENENENEKNGKNEKLSIGISSNFFQEQNKDLDVQKWKDHKMFQLTNYRIQEFFSQILLKTQSNIRDFRLNSKPLVGVVNGIIPVGGIQKKPESVETNNIHFDIISSSILIRDDINERLRNRSFLLPKKVNGKNVLFEVPKYDIQEKLDLSRIQKDPEYVKNLQNQLIRLDQLHQINSIKFSNNILKFQNQDILFQKQEIHEMIEDLQTLGSESFYKIFKTSIPLDRFSDFISDFAAIQIHEISYSQIIQNFLLEKNFEYVFELFEQTCSFMSQAKISEFLSTFLESQNTLVKIEEFAEKGNVEFIYSFANAMNILEEIPALIFPLNKEMPFYVKNLFKEPTSEIENYIFIHYCLFLIMKKFKNRTQAFTFAGNIDMFLQFIKQFTKKFHEILASKFTQLYSNFITAISSRSFSISCHYTFLLNHLLQVLDPTIFELFTKNNIKIIDDIRILTRSKYSHVQIFCQKIWETMLNNSNWIGFIVNYYSDNFSNIIGDLSFALKSKQNTQKNVVSHNQENQKPQKASLMAILVDNLFEKLFDSKKTNQLFDILSSKLLTPTLFSNLILVLEGFIASKSQNESLVLFSKFIRMIIQSYSEKYLQNMRKDQQMHLTINISKGSIEKILFIISSTPAILDEVKINLVAALNSMMKIDHFFNDIVKLSGFYSTIIDLFRSTTTFGLSFEIWNLFFETIVYHPGFVDVLAQNKQLQFILESISTTSYLPILIIGLKHLDKIFNMAKDEEIRINKFNQPTRITEKNSLKSIEKDLKNFCDFFLDNSLFVKLHMILKKIEGVSQGLIFVNLSSVYHTIANNESCLKIYTQAIKGEQYSLGFKFMNSFYKSSKNKSEKKNPKNRWRRTFSKRK